VELILLLYAYPKNVMADLTPKQVARLAKVVKEERAIRRKNQPFAVWVRPPDGVSVKTLQNWEQDRRRPTGPAVALLRIIAQQAKLAVEAIHGR